MSGPAFGFSVGDFIAAIELTSKVVKGLKQTGGAATRYIQVLQQLENLRRILNDLEGLVPSQDDAAFVNAIRGAARAAKFPLDDFLAKIEQYDRALNPANRKGTAGRAPKAAKWTLLVDSEVEKLLESLHVHCMSLSLFLQLRERRVGDIRESRRKLEHEDVKAILNLQTISVDNIRTTLDSIQTESQRGYRDPMNSIASVQISSQSNAATLNDVKQLAASLADKLSEVSGANRQQYQQITQAIMNSTAQLLRLQRDIARAPAIQPDSYIHILDALDRRHKLPYDIFQNFELVQTHLATQFDKVPGGMQVKAGLYQLVREGRTPRIVTADDWANLIFPGAHLSMAIMLSSLRIPPNRCPRPTCNRLVDARDLQRTRLRCDQCHLIYYPYSPQRLYGPRSELQVVANLQLRHDRDEYGRRRCPADASVIASVSSATMSEFTVTSKSKSKSYSAQSGSTRPTTRKATISKPTSDAPFATDHLVVTGLTPLTIKNLVLWEDSYDKELSDQQQLPQAPASGQVTLPGIDWKSGPSPMMAWLNSSAIPSPGDHAPPAIEETQVQDDGFAIDEEDDLEILRRVCIARSTPAARHYLDAPEYAGMEGQAIIYLRKILDLFPIVPPVIARRLAERNWAWMQRLAMTRATSNFGAVDRTRNRSKTNPSDQIAAIRQQIDKIRSTIHVLRCR